MCKLTVGEGEYPYLAIKAKYIVLWGRGLAPISVVSSKTSGVGDKIEGKKVSKLCHVTVQERSVIICVSCVAGIALSRCKV